MLSTKYGENWTRYLQAIVFSYNASYCESTRHTPYFLMHGREPELLESVAMEHVHAKTPEDIEDISARLAAAYKIVAKAQARMAALNRELQRAAKHNLAQISYRVSDYVLYWEPAQAKRLAAHDGDATIAPRNAPGKWKPRWTGPHRVTAVEKGKYSNRYTILHGGRKRKIENVKPDKLFPYHPWSEQVPTTSPHHEHDLRGYEVGTRCEKGSLFIVPLNRPHPFGVGKAIDTEDVDNVKFQWFEPAMNDCDALGPFQPMWINAEHTETYIAKEPIKDTDTAYTNDITGIEIAQRDIILHGFSLTEDEKIPQDVLDACTEHTAIWWAQRRDKRRRIPHRMRTRTRPAE